MRALIMGFVLTTLASAAAQALDAGDVISLSSKGVSETVIGVGRTDPSTYAISSKALAANAAEFCQRYEALDPASAKGRECIRENTSTQTTQIAVDCRTMTIIVQTGAGSGSYRPSEGGGSWASVADPNMVIQGDNLFRQVCAVRSR